MTQIISVLYCGDDTLEQGARYLLSVFRYLRYNVTYVPSRKKISVSLLKKQYNVIILSDYPSAMLTSEVQRELVRKVERGTGFLMVGGWGSFRGYDGHYERTLLKNVLPVSCLLKDDRVNAFQGAVIGSPLAAHVFSERLDFSCPPIIGGYNKVIAAGNSTVVLTVKRIFIDSSGIHTSEDDPLLVVGNFGEGKTACFMSDFAPHWSGGLVDWGQKRISLKTPSGNYMEVGNYYITFIKSLIKYVAS